MIEKLEHPKRNGFMADQSSVDMLVDKVDELIDAVNDHEDMLYGLDCDCANYDDDDDDLCDECRAERGAECGCPDTDDTIVIDTKDGLLADFIVYCLDHPELRFYQALASWSGYRFIFGSTAMTCDDFSQIEDTFYKTDRGPRQ